VAARALAGVHHLPDGEALGRRGSSPEDEERRVAGAGVEAAPRRAPERPAGEAERRARAAAEVGPVALLLAVDRAVAAGDAGARVEVALRALEAAAHEPERLAGLALQGVAVALLPRVDVVVAAQRGQRDGGVGVVGRGRLQAAAPVGTVRARASDALERAVV